MVHLGPFSFIAPMVAWIRLLTTFPCKRLGVEKDRPGELGRKECVVSGRDSRWIFLLYWLSFVQPPIVLVKNNPFLILNACPGVHKFSSSYSIFDFSHRIHQVSDLHKSIDDQHVIIRRGQNVDEHEIFFLISEGWSDQWCHILPPDCIFSVIFL